jgi:hypothetical protein
MEGTLHHDFFFQILWMFTSFSLSLFLLLILPLTCALILCMLISIWFTVQIVVKSSGKLICHVNHFWSVTSLEIWIALDFCMVFLFFSLVWSDLLILAGSM